MGISLPIWKDSGSNSHDAHEGSTHHGPKGSEMGLSARSRRNTSPYPDSELGNSLQLAPSLTSQGGAGDGEGGVCTEREAGVRPAAGHESNPPLSRPRRVFAVVGRWAWPLAFPEPALPVRSTPDGERGAVGWEGSGSLPLAFCASAPQAVPPLESVLLPEVGLNDPAGMRRRGPRSRRIGARDVPDGASPTVGSPRTARAPVSEGSMPSRPASALLLAPTVSASSFVRRRISPAVGITARRGGGMQVASFPPFFASGPLPRGWGLLLTASRAWRVSGDRSRGTHASGGGARFAPPDLLVRGEDRA